MLKSYEKGKEIITDPVERVQNHLNEYVHEQSIRRSFTHIDLSNRKEPKMVQLVEAQDVNKLSTPDGTTPAAQLMKEYALHQSIAGEHKATKWKCMLSPYHLYVMYKFQNFKKSQILRALEAYCTKKEFSFDPIIWAIRKVTREGESSMVPKEPVMRSFLIKLTQLEKPATRLELPTRPKPAYKSLGQSRNIKYYPSPFTVAGKLFDKHRATWKSKVPIYDVYLMYKFQLLESKTIIKLIKGPGGEYKPEYQPQPTLSVIRKLTKTGDAKNCSASIKDFVLDLAKQVEPETKEGTELPASDLIDAKRTILWKGIMIEWSSIASPDEIYLIYQLSNHNYKYAYDRFKNYRPDSKLSFNQFQSYMNKIRQMIITKEPGRLTHCVSKLVEELIKRKSAIWTPPKGFSVGVSRRNSSRKVVDKTTPVEKIEVLIKDVSKQKAMLPPPEVAKDDEAILTVAPAESVDNCIFGILEDDKVIKTALDLQFLKGFLEGSKSTGAIVKISYL
jgi:hypothetical protein